MTKAKSGGRSTIGASHKGSKGGSTPPLHIKASGAMEGKRLYELSQKDRVKPMHPSTAPKLPLFKLTVDGLVRSEKGTWYEKEDVEEELAKIETCHRNTHQRALVYAEKIEEQLKLITLLEAEAKYLDAENDNLDKENEKLKDGTELALLKDENLQNNLEEISRLRKYSQKLICETEKLKAKNKKEYMNGYNHGFDADKGILKQDILDMKARIKELKKPEVGIPSMIGSWVRASDVKRMLKEKDKQIKDLEYCMEYGAMPKKVKK